MKLTQIITMVAFGLTLTHSTVAQTAAPAIHIDEFTMKRCVNLGNNLDAPTEGEWGEKIDLAYFPMIKEAGFDTVRIPVRWSAHIGPAPNYSIDPVFMARVDEVVNSALSADLNVILNIHHFDEIMETPKGELRKLVELWRQIGTQFSQSPSNLWFEALNEPNKNLEGPIMRAAQKASILAIRESNPSRVIILGGEKWSNIRTLHSNMAPPDDNIVYTFHYYDPFNFTHQKAKWLGKDMPKKKRGWGDKADYDELKLAVATATAFRAQVNRPVFMGEFGANDGIKNKHRVKWAGAVSQKMEQADIPWCLWSFTNTFALYNARSKRWDDDMMQALQMSGSWK